MSFATKMALLAFVLIAIFLAVLIPAIEHSNQDCLRRECPAGLTPYPFVQEGCLCVGMPK